MIWQKQNGQALPEVLIVSLLFILLVSLTIALLWIGFIKLRAEDLLHEALVCQASEARAHQIPCEFHAIHGLQALPGKPRVERVSWGKSPRHISIEVLLEARSWWQKKIFRQHFKRSLRLPLAARDNNS